jgi:hypothetical protein
VTSGVNGRKNSLSRGRWTGGHADRPEQADQADRPRPIAMRAASVPGLPRAGMRNFRGPLHLRLNFRLTGIRRPA